MTETTIKGTDIKPLLAWRIGVINETKDALLVAEFHDGTSATIAMPPEAAVELGRALALQGEKSKHAK